MITENVPTQVMANRAAKEVFCGICEQPFQFKRMLQQKSHLGSLHTAPNIVAVKESFRLRKLNHRHICPLDRFSETEFNARAAVLLITHAMQCTQRNTDTVSIMQPPAPRTVITVNLLDRRSLS